MKNNKFQHCLPSVLINKIVVFQAAHFLPLALCFQFRENDNTSQPFQVYLSLATAFHFCFVYTSMQLLYFLAGKAFFCTNSLRFSFLWVIYLHSIHHSRIFSFVKYFPCHFINFNQRNNCYICFFSSHLYHFMN